jgi:Bifunctional DNA primase/polymerase, N-terminal/Primase C terminal 1 (PriCT-1)
MSVETLEAALRQASRRRPMFPCDARNKRPLTPHGFKDASTDRAKITAWFRDTDAMIGMPTGAVSGLVVVDLDGTAGFESWRELEREHGDLPPTASVTTPRGGQHLYLKHPGVEVRCSAGTLGAGVDIRGDGGYVIVPPSRMADGRAYIVDDESAVAGMPEWLLRTTAATRNGTQAARPSSGWVAIVRDGVRGPDVWSSGPGEGRNDKLTRFVGHLLRRYIDPVLVAEMAHLVNECRFAPPLPRSEVDKLLESIAAKELRRRATVSNGVRQAVAR